MKVTKKQALVLNFLKRVASPIAVISLIVLAVKEIPGAQDVLTWAFRNASPSGQAIIVIVAAVGLIYFAVVYVLRAERVGELKAERDSLEERLLSKEAELKQVEENNIRLAEEGVKEDIWKRPVGGASPFVEKGQRNAVFISLLNLKGGVGKTTLAANLGACLALMDRPLKVLLIDLDFQATLSNMSVEAGTLLTAGELGATSSRLLQGGLSAEEFRKLTVGVNRVPGARIAIADVGLERMDFQTQAKYFLKPDCDVRFRFRSVLHQKEVTERFDVVLFDCPPRLTTSTVNALTCSDYVLIPSKLDERSFEAIPRTLAFIDNLKMICQPKIIGIVANEVQYWRRPSLLKTHQAALARLGELVKSKDPDLYVFRSHVELSTNVAFHTEKSVLPCVDEALREQLFLPTVGELRARIGK